MKKSPHNDDLPFALVTTKELAPYGVLLILSQVRSIEVTLSSYVKTAVASILRLIHSGIDNAVA